MNPYTPQRPPLFPDYNAFLLAKRNERRAIRTLGLYIGSAILLYLVLQNILTLPLALPMLHDKYNTDGLFQNGVDILVITASMLLPFLAMSKLMRNVSGCEEPLPLEKPKGGADLLLIVPAGLMVCMAANYITDLLVTLISGFGVELSTPDLPLPTGALGVTTAVFRVVIMPAVVEEFCFRGVVMQHLRRFGNGFAAVAAALCFGLLHCNLVQMPFAFTVGLALGFFVLRTGSLWPAILIHALNNTVSLVFSYLYDALAVQHYQLIYALVQGILFGSGAICFLVYLYRTRETAETDRPARTVCTFGEKLGACFSSPTMLISICAVLYFTSRYVGLT